MLILPYSSKKNQSGQALLLVLLVMSLVLTLILSSVSKSVTDVDISKYEDNAIRAFDAAQAGIEKGIIGAVPALTPVPLSNGASYTPEFSTLNRTGNMYLYPIELYSGESAYFWFVDHVVNANGDLVISCAVGSCGQTPEHLRICWGKENTPLDNSSPAVYGEIYYTSDTGTPEKLNSTNINYDLSDIKIATFSADPYKDSRSPVNNFSGLVDSDTNKQKCTGIAYAYSSLFASTDNPMDSLPAKGLLYLKITLLYNTSVPHPIGIRVSGNMSDQGSIVSSVGQSGDVYRKLILYQGYPELPSEFGHVIYSKNNLIK